MGEAMDMLMAACSANGLIQDDGFNAVQKTLNSGLNAGIAEPRNVPESKKCCNKTEVQHPRIWETFLDDATKGDRELQRFLQQMCGYIRP